MIETLNFAKLRTIQLRDPQAALRHFIEPAQTLVRAWDTTWRGPVVFTGAQFAWALSEVREILPLAKGGFLWCLTELQWLPRPLLYHCNQVQREHFFQFERMEPLFASANLCHDIEALYRPVAPPEPQVPAGFGPSLLREAYRDFVVDQAVDKALQLSLF